MWRYMSRSVSPQGALVLIAIGGIRGSSHPAPFSSKPVAVRSSSRSILRDVPPGNGLEGIFGGVVCFRQARLRRDDPASAAKRPTIRRVVGLFIDVGDEGGRPGTSRTVCGDCALPRQRGKFAVGFAHRSAAGAPLRRITSSRGSPRPNLAAAEEVHLRMPPASPSRRHSSKQGSTDWASR